MENNLVSTINHIITSNIGQIAGHQSISSSGISSFDSESQSQNYYSCRGCGQRYALTRVCLCYDHIHDDCGLKYLRRKFKMSKLDKFYYEKDFDDIKYIQCLICKHKIRFTAQKVYMRRSCNQIKQYAGQNKFSSALGVLATFLVLAMLALIILLILNMVGVLAWVQPSRENISLFVLLLVTLVLMQIVFLYLTLRHVLSIVGIEQAKLYLYEIRIDKKQEQKQRPQK